MLLPSSAANPANMMAQALTIYKSLIGNVSGSQTRTSGGLHEDVKESNLAAEIGGDSDQTVRIVDEYQNGSPRFSLQSPKNAE